MTHHQWLVERNDARPDSHPDTCLHHLFEAQATRTPHATAVVVENEHLSYQELDRRANQLAHYLQALGVGPDVRVGICVERSLDMIVGMLGILKAGGAYVPLDPRLPQERLAVILADTQAPALLTQEPLLASLPAHGIRQVCLDSEWETIARLPDTRPVSATTPEHLVYVLFTSGSTGCPKGVAIEHRQLLNYLSGILPRLDLPAGASFALVSTFAADLGNTVVFPALCTGGCLHVVTRERASDPAALADYFSRYPIDCLKIVPSHLMALLSGAQPERVIPRRRLVLGGEAASWQLIDWVRQLAPDCRILNHYGPTETTVGVLTYKVEDGPTERHAAVVPLGYPLDNTQIYILDSEMRPVQAGEPGEIFIGGAGLARGYLGHPNLTARQFVPNPFGTTNDECPTQNSRLYRTGDLGHYLPDGAIVFLGRIDHQVKIRGFRIELSEIEAALKRHPAVQSAVVLAREDTPGDQQLVAYVVPTTQRAPCSLSVCDLRTFLKTVLPSYMLPAAFVMLAALPLTPNGKIDRQALPAPDRSRRDLDTPFVAPRTPVEELLAGIWMDVLCRADIGINDNFFELGGNSLLATQVVSRVRAALQVELPLSSLFDIPTVAGLAETLIEGARASEAEAGDTARHQAIEPRVSGAPIPLSFAQQRLWFLDQLAPDSAFYNLPVALLLHGPLDLPALVSSLTALVTRHESLRTSFPASAGQPCQQIAAPQPVALPLADLSALPPTDRDAAAAHLLRAAARIPFDLAHGPLFRVLLVRLAHTEHVLLLTMHHSIADGWSIDVLFRDLSALYTAANTGTPATLAPLPIQYADYARWQRHWLAGARLQSQRAYWQQQLAGAPPLLELPSDRPRPPVQTFAGARMPLALPPALRAALLRLSHQTGATLFMTLLASFQVLLARYSGRTDILVGTPIAGRTRAELEGLIGFFVNTLVLRTDLAGDPTFRTLLGRVREVCLGAYAHQDLPFEMLVEELHPERNLSFNPLFQVTIALQNDPLRSYGLPGLTAEYLDLDGGKSRFDIALLMRDTGQELVGVVEYNTDLFDGTTIARMLGHFETLLEAVVASPEQPISQLPLLTAAEQRQLLHGWNATQAEYPTDACVQELFEAQAARMPDATALVFEDESLTYHELNARANQLAHYLQARGVGPDVLVGVCMERSLAMVVGLLGILKAGGAYVPLDPSYPSERLAFMLADAGAPLLLTNRHLAVGLSIQGRQVICLDAEWEAIARERSENPVGGTTPAHLAYMIYTSGSTGTPKGVQIEQRGLLNLVFWHRQTFGIGSEDRATQIAGPAFDATVWELWPALTAGASVYLPNEETRISPPQLRDWLVSRAITVCFLPTPLAEQALSLEWPAGTALRTMLTGGDKLHRCPSPTLPFELVNNYGPTEITVVATSGGVPAAEHGDSTPSIGRAIANTQLYVLDQHLRPVPIGVPGELYIGGAGMARGYLNRPELTAERFIPNPFAVESGVRGQGSEREAATPDDPSLRLYRTGDLVRYRADGQIEFLGRIDQQVKIRGFRIELGEIEAVLAQHPGVREALVLAHEDAPGTKRLVAYVVTSDELQVTRSDKQTGSSLVPELRNFLHEQLPEYMVPTTFMLLHALPLTPNGKVDRRALPAPELAGLDLEGAFTAPRNDVEAVLAQIWSDVLGRERVGVHDNFFALGGHSLLATCVVAQITNALEVHLSLRSLFESPTVAELAALILETADDRERIERTAGLLLWLAEISEEELEQEVLLAKEA